MTPQELRELADQIEIEQHKPKKRGNLKYDLYNFNSNSSSGLVFHRDWGDFWLKTQAEMENLINEFKDEFELVLKAGSEFVCFINEDGEEQWFDNENYGVEVMSGKWAEKYLENIRPYGEVNAKTKINN